MIIIVIITDAIEGTMTTEGIRIEIGGETGMGTVEIRIEIEVKEIEEIVIVKGVVQEEVITILNLKMNPKPQVLVF